LVKQRIPPANAIQYTDEQVPQKNKKTDNGYPISANLPCGISPILLLRGVSKEPPHNNTTGNNDDVVISIRVPHPTEPVTDTDVSSIYSK
jgi:hypothetical protein